MARLPLNALRTMAAGVRRRLPALTNWNIHGFVPIGCDGSRLECPRAQTLEQRLGQAGKDGEYTVRGIAEACQAADTNVGMVVEVDSGGHRAGVQNASRRPPAKLSDRVEGIELGVWGGGV